MTDEIEESEEGGVSSGERQNAESTQKAKFDWISFNDYVQSLKAVGGISGGLFLLIFGGQQIGWGIGLPHFTDRLDSNPDHHFDLSDTIKTYGNVWFLFGLLGAFLSFCNLLGARKRWIYLIGSGLNIISTILLANYQFAHPLLFYARIFSGISYGLTYTTIIKHAGDLAMPKVRGFVVGLIHLSIILGIFINATIFAYKPPHVCPHFLNGIVGLFLTGCGITCNYLVTVESPLDLVKRKMKNEAIGVIAYLRSTNEDDPLVQESFDDMEKMINEESKEISLNIFSKSNFYPLLLTLLLRLAFIASFNYFVNCITVVEDLAVRPGTSVAITGIRLLGVIFGLLTIDWKRGWQFFGIVITGAIAAILGLTSYIFDRDTYLFSAPTLTIIFLLLSGMCLGPILDVYTTEVFSNAKKQMSIIFLVLAELGIQSLIFVETFKHSSPVDSHSFVYSFSGLFMLGVGLKLYLVGPETSQLSLRESRNKFNNNIYFG